MEFFRKNITPIIIAALLTAIGTLFTIGWAQTEKKIDTKADKGEILLMIQKLEALRTLEQDRAKEDRNEQKALNNTLIQTLQQLNQQIWILNQRIRVEPTGNNNPVILIPTN